MGQCILHPRLNNGEKSPLFTKLMSFLGSREAANEVYYRAIHPEFREAFPNVRFDENGEPLFDDLITYCNIGENVVNEQKLAALNEIYSTKPAPRTVESASNLQRQAASFNTNNSLNSEYTAVVEETEGGIHMVLKEKTTDSELIGQQQRFNAELNSRLVDLMHSWGADVGALTDLEESMGINGVMDLDSATNAATGLKEVIRLAKGEEGQMALPEEWGHFVVDTVQDSPLRDRVLNTLKNKEVLKRLFGDEYQKYYEVYDGNIEDMAKEMLGKMMAQVLNSYDPSAPNDKLFERYKNQVLNFFASKDADVIDDIINEVKEMVYQFTTDAFSGKYTLNINNPHFTRRLYNLSNTASREHKLLESVIQKERKRLALYGSKASVTVEQKEQSQGNPTHFDERQIELINNLKAHLESHTELDGLYSYLEDACTLMDQLSKKLQTTYNSSDKSWKEKFHTLRGIRNYIYSYCAVIDIIQETMYEASKEGDDRFKDKLAALIQQFSGLASTLATDWVHVSRDAFADFLAPFEGEGISMYVRGERRQYTIKEVLTVVDQDISIMDRWTDAMADSTDPILKIYDSLVKKHKGRARQATISDEKMLTMHALKLERTGIKNTEFMYERRTKDGRLSGNFVTKTNWSDFYTAMAEYANSLPKDMSKSDKAIKIAEWRRVNTDKEGNPIDKYNNPQYEAIQKNDAMREYYNFVMDLKRKKDLRLPAAYVRYNKAPQVRRDFLERMLSSTSKGKYLWETIKDSLVRREDDTDFFYARQDFEGNQLYMLPIYYTKSLKDREDLSLDCTSAMVAYCAMANDYASLDDVVDALETGRYILKSRKFQETSGGKPITESIAGVVEGVLGKGEASRAMGRLDDFMTMLVYGHLRKDEGTLFGVDIGKFADMVNKLQSFTSTAASVLTGTSNLLQNITMANIEAASRKYFTPAQLLEADKLYWKLLPEYLGETGKRIKTSTLALILEKFNVLQDYDRSVRDINWQRKNIFSRMLKADTLWLTTSMGDHYTQSRVALALLIKNNVIDKDGNPVKMIDALKRSYIDPAHPEYGATIDIDPTEYKSAEDKTVDADLYTQMSNLIRGINDKLYGIYNTEGKNALQHRALGRLVMFFRNWMRPLWLKRFGVEKYNFDTQDFEKGYYRDLWTYITAVAKDLKKGEVNLIKNYHKLNEEQKANFRRAIAELVRFAILSFVVMALKSLPDDDDEDDDEYTGIFSKTWFFSYGAYAIIKLKADMGAMVPGPTMIDEGIRLFDSPFASIRVLKNLRQLLNLVNPDVWTEEIDSGVFKGYTQAEKILLQPIPLVKQTLNLFDPDEPARWYK